MSALRSSAGAAVWTSGTPSSAAMMCASEVLPSPGGPERSTWSSGSPRRRAASMKTASWSVTASCATKSSSRGGRSERSRSSSGSAARDSAIGASGPSGRTGTSGPLASNVGSGTIPGCDPPPRSAPRAVASAARRRAMPIRSSGLSPSAPSRSRSASISEYPRPTRPSRASSRGSPSPSASAFAAIARHGRLLELAGNLLAELDDHPLRRALADARGGLEALVVAEGDRLQELARRSAGEDRDRDLRADARDRVQVEEEVALLLACEAVELDRVVADDEVRMECRLLAVRRDGLERLGRDGEPVADSAGLDRRRSRAGAPGPRR